MCRTSLVSPEQPVLCIPIAIRIANTLPNGLPITSCNVFEMHPLPSCAIRKHKHIIQSHLGNNQSQNPCHITSTMTTQNIAILLPFFAGADPSPPATFFLSFLSKSSQLLVKEIAFWAFGLRQFLLHDGVHIQSDTILGL